jgi:hypothetical protein
MSGQVIPMFHLVLGGLAVAPVLCHAFLLLVLSNNAYAAAGEIS